MGHCPAATFAGVTYVHTLRMRRVFAVTCRKCWGAIVLGWGLDWAYWGVDIRVFFWDKGWGFFWGGRFAWGDVVVLVGTDECVRIGVVRIWGVGCIGAIFVNGVNDVSGGFHRERGIVVDCKADLHSVGRWVFIAGAKPCWIVAQSMQCDSAD